MSEFSEFQTVGAASSYSYVQFLHWLEAKEADWSDVLCHVRLGRIQILVRSTVFCCWFSTTVDINEWQTSCCTTL